MTAVGTKTGNAHTPVSSLIPTHLLPKIQQTICPLMQFLKPGKKIEIWAISKKSDIQRRTFNC